LYLDTCIEPWPGGYTDPKLSVEARSNYKLREERWRCAAGNERGPHRRAHPRRQSGIGVALRQAGAAQHRRDTGRRRRPRPRTRAEWAKSRAALGIKVMHIAERDTQVSNVPKRPGEFVNTWSVDGFVSEGAQPAELGWGTHEKHFPRMAGGTTGSWRAIYLTRPGAARACAPGRRAPRATSTASDHPQRGDLDRRLLHGARGCTRRLPPDRALRLSSERQCGAVGARAGRAQLVQQENASASCWTRSPGHR
jgi:hypothetical protein